MSRPLRAWAALLAASWLWATACLAQPRTSPRGRPLEAALERPATLEFVETPLDDAAAWLSDACGVPVELDRKTLARAGVNVDRPITFRIAGAPLGEALDVTLDQVGLAWTVRDGGLRITGPREAGAPVRRTYRLDGLAGPDATDGQIDAAYRDLSRAVWTLRYRLDSAERSEGDNSFQAGEATTCQAVPDAAGARLVVEADFRIHRKVARLLRAIRGMARPRQGPSSDPSPLEAARQRLELAFAQEVCLGGRAEPLVEVTADLQRKTGVEIFLDWAALTEAGVGYDTRVSCPEWRCPLDQMLDDVLLSVGLNWTIHDGVVLVTTPGPDRSKVMVRVYDLAEMVGAGESIGPHDLWRARRLYEAAVGDTTGGLGPPEAETFLVTTDRYLALVAVGTYREQRQFARWLRSGMGVLEELPEVPAEPDIERALRLSERERAIRRRLDQEVSLEVEGVLLPALTAELEGLLGTPVARDEAGLWDVAVGPDWPRFTGSFAGVPLRTVLDRLLSPQHVAWVVRDDGILLTSSDQAERMRRTQLFDVTDLVKGDGDGKMLIDVVRVAAAAHATPGADVRLVPKQEKTLLAVTHNDETLRQIEDFLEGLRGLDRSGGRNPGEPSPDVWPVISDADRRIEGALAEETSLEFFEAPICDVAAYIAEHHGIPVKIDQRSSGLFPGSSAAVRIDVSGLSLRSALDRLASDHGGGWIVRDGVLLITDEEKARRNTLLRVYPVDGVARAGAGRRGSPSSGLSAEFVRRFVAPRSWETLGGYNAIACYTRGRSHVLVVRASREVHREIGDFLAAIRVAAGDEEAAPPVTTRELTARRRIERALGEPTDLWFIEAPLQDMVDFLADYHDISVLLDRRALDRADVAADTPISANARHLPLRDALSKVLDRIGLTWIVRDESLLITTPEEAGRMAAPRVLCVEGLVPVGSVSETGDAARKLLERIRTSIPRPGPDQVSPCVALDVAVVGNCPVLVAAGDDRVISRIAEMVEQFRGAAVK